MSIASEVAEERAQSNGEGHLRYLVCQNTSTSKGVDNDSDSFRNDVLLINNHSVRMAMIEADRGPEQIH